jgi:predicted transcriptional regulator
LKRAGVYSRLALSQRFLVWLIQLRDTFGDFIRRFFEKKGAIQMMDHERTEKELQEVFQEIQQSYKALVDNASALQERTLELAQRLFESSTEDRSQSTQGTLEALANESRDQREALEKLLRKSDEAFMKVLGSPYDEHHHKVEEAKADLEEASPS